MKKRIKKFLGKANGVRKNIIKSIKKGMAYTAYAMNSTEKHALINQKDAGDSGSAIVQQANRHTALGQLLYGTGHNEQTKIGLEKYLRIMDRIDRVQIKDVEYITAVDQQTGELYIKTAEFKTEMISEAELAEKRRTEMLSVTDKEAGTDIEFVWHYVKDTKNSQAMLEEMIKKANMSIYGALATELNTIVKIAEGVEAPKEEIYENIQVVRDAERNQYSIENTLTAVHHKIIDEDGERKDLLEFYTTLRRLSTEDEEDALKDMKRVFLTFHHHRNNDVRVFDILGYRNTTIHMGKLVFKFYVKEVLEAEILTEKVV